MNLVKRTADVAAQGAFFGVAGWMLENAMFGQRFSALFGGRRVPFLPVYAIGGSTALALAPRLRKANVPWPLRAAAYAALLSGVEYAGCQFERRQLGACSWDYSGAACAKPNQGCIDLPHALLWGALGLLLERTAP